MSKNKQQNIFVPNKELLGRMNFLYQASMLMANTNNCTLSAYYARQCQTIGKRAQLKISPDVKRNFCKRCALAQQPGRTTDVEIMQRKRKRCRNKRMNEADENIDLDAEVFMKCRKCGNKRKFIVKPDYNFWLEKPEAVEVLKTQKEQQAKKEIETKNNNIKNKNSNKSAAAETAGVEGS